MRVSFPKEVAMRAILASGLILFSSMVAAQSGQNLAVGPDNGFFRPTPGNDPSLTNPGLAVGVAAQAQAQSQPQPQPQPVTVPVYVPVPVATPPSPAAAPVERAEQQLDRAQREAEEAQQKAK